MNTTETFPTPLAHAPLQQVIAERQSVMANSLLVQMLESMPDYVLLLNQERQILAFNTNLVTSLGLSDPDTLIGKRPGEAFGCIFAGEGHDGCGSGDHCTTCGAADSIFDALCFDRQTTQECRITVGMSRALDFLLQHRPQAMGAYFQFVKDNGSRLDPKTRALISVITKVAVETELGLVQYTRKAYEVGCTADEVLDALMMAFPALGLSKIVWAVDVLIAHDIEGFAEAAGRATASSSAAAVAGGAKRVDAGSLAALPMQQTVKYSSGGRPLLLWRDGDTVRAFKAYCSHQGMELMASGIRGNTVTCAQHGWSFEMPEGRCARGDRWALTELPVHIENGRVTVEWRD